MSQLKRVSFSIEAPLYAALEKRAKRKGYTNRSKHLCDVIRDALVEQASEDDRECLGTITLVYDHNRRALSDRLVKLQHDHFHDVLASTHVHLSHDLCAEAVLVRAKASKVKALADLLGRQKGVLHASLSLSSTGAALPHSH
jgi:CopG family nickel-responsive transcriptional regulator